MVKSKTKKSHTAKHDHHSKHHAKNHARSSSRREKDHKKKFWGVVSVALTIIVIILAVSLASKLMAKHKADDIKVEVPLDGNPVDITGEQVHLIIIHDPQCVICEVDTFAKQVNENLIPKLKVTKMTIDDSEAQFFVNSIGAPFLPLYIFDDKIENRADWQQMRTSFSDLNLEGETFHILDPSAVQYKAAVNEIPILEDTIVVGDEDAPITIYTFTDYECEFCAIAEGNPELVEEFQKRVPDYKPPVPNVLSEYVDTGIAKFVFFNYPVSQSHPTSVIAHNAALCANEQDSFRIYHENLVEKRSEWVVEDRREEIFTQYAGELGLDEEEFNTCLTERRYDSQIQSELQLGIVFGVRGTPAFFVEKNFIPGAQDFEVFKQIVDLELNR